MSNLNDKSKLIDYNITDKDITDNNKQFKLKLSNAIYNYPNIFIWTSDKNICIIDKDSLLNILKKKFNLATYSSFLRSLNKNKFTRRKGTQVYEHKTFGKKFYPSYLNNMTKSCSIKDKSNMKRKIDQDFIQNKRKKISYHYEHKDNINKMLSSIYDIIIQLKHNFCKVIDECNRISAEQIIIKNDINNIKLSYTRELERLLNSISNNNKTNDSEILDNRLENQRSNSFPLLYSSDSLTSLNKMNSFNSTDLLSL